MDGLFKLSMVVLLSIFLLSNCNNTEPEMPSFSGMELKYELISDIAFSEDLDIAGSGMAKGKFYIEDVGFVRDTLFLESETLGKLADHCLHFGEFERLYTSEDWSEYYEFHTIFFSNEGVRDTVQVRNPHEITIPEDLRGIIDEISGILQQMRTRKENS